MKFVSNENFTNHVYLVEAGQDLTMVDQTTQDYLKEQLDFKGEAKQVYSSLGPNSQKLVLVGLGEKPQRDSYVLAAFLAAKELKAAKVEEANVSFASTDRAALEGVIEGFLQSDYRFDRYLSEKNTSSLAKINLAKKVADLDQVVAEVTHLVEGINATRDLVNTPSNHLSPAQMADQAKDLLSGLGVEVEIFDKKQIEDLGMEALLAVNAGSVNEPRFLVMNYLPQGPEEKAIALVGKGITYDSGGYALKPANSMIDMKDDMAGAAAVIGSIYALAKNKVNKNVVGVAAITENLVSATSYKNGDIIGSMKGTTIEVLNTDAEGRVTLADSIYYAAAKVNSECVIDLATLTGACLVALGGRTAGAMTNNPDLLEAVDQAADSVGEPIWQLPAPEELREAVKGTNADLRNSTGRNGGTITAGVFLEHFVEGKPWVHLDIAGPAFGEKAYRYLPQGATGVPVKTLYQFVKGQAEPK
ncbi:leucyl aminopeptidase [Aerococcus urinae]|uniref:leucyl aminopeptidase n=1 Tax=Aerococcus urinae TaxID=1376 RepID=UPI000762FE06|nr:leucyl aminopeptidase [Aerococcus urinae]AMB95246.1 hypothetical protein AWM73_01375 [Aerococcus urinae]